MSEELTAKKKVKKGKQKEKRIQNVSNINVKRVKLFCGFFVKRKDKK